jgi:hypothetical protein
VANSGQRCRWLCAGGAGGDSGSGFLHGALHVELADMTIEFLSVAVLVAIVLGLLS